MNPIVGTCPVCGERMRIVRLNCSSCGTSLEGNFDLGQFLRLNPDQWHFVDVFLKCRGKIKDVEEELGISYPTVVARLNEVVSSLGHEARASDEETQEARTRILDDLSEGRLSASEAANRLREL